MTTAAKALLAELKRIESQVDHTVSVSDGKACKETFGDDAWNDANMQSFVESGFEFAGGNFQHKMAVAIAWIYLGYCTALTELGVINNGKAILPTDAITKELLHQYAEEMKRIGKVTQEKQIAVAEPLCDAMNGAPDFTSWCQSGINTTLQIASKSGHIEKALQSIFVLAILVGWELAQLHIENQMKATESGLTQ